MWCLLSTILCACGTRVVLPLLIFLFFVLVLVLVLAASGGVSLRTP